MRLAIFTAVSAALLISTPGLAQDYGQGSAATSQDPGSPAPGEPTAPDGSKAFGIEPYFGVLGGYEWFDNQRTKAGIPQPAGRRNYKGTLVEGVLGVNVPLGPVFVGAEGNVIKGVEGDIDWQYGAAGRFGLRAGESGLVYGKVGYQWVNFDALGNNSRDYHEMTYGIGVEVGPKSIGLGGVTGNSGVRLRVEANTFGSAKSLRPMAGLIAHF